MTLIVTLFAVGLLLLAAEVFMPGAILGIIGAALLLAGCVLAFVRLGTLEGLVAIAITFAAGAALFYLQFSVLPKTRFGKRLFLEKSVEATATALGDEVQCLIGKVAQSITILAPSGYVLIDGKRYEAFSRSGHIPPGNFLKVVDVNHFQIIVEAK